MQSSNKFISHLKRNSKGLYHDKDFSHNEVVIPCVDNNQETKDDFANIAEHGIYDIC